MSTGLEWQDEQHQQIFKRIDQLLDAMEHNMGNKVVKDLIDFLGDYARSHFREEEAYMMEHRCTSYGAHKKCHDEFISRLSEIFDLYNKQGASTVVVMRLQSWLCDWLINHIMNVDQKMLSACSA
jgi:hemerythrin